jgi:mono/diheme cytochrome c family protein
MRIILFVPIFALVAAPLARAAASPAPASAPSHPPRHERHHQLDYDRYCVWCHGPGGEGDGVSARSLASPPADLTRLQLDDAALREIVLHGRPGTPMPGFTALAPSQVDSLVTFIQHLAHDREE